jgi:hypothetical protein
VALLISIKAQAGRIRFHGGFLQRVVAMSLPTILTLALIVFMFAGFVFTLGGVTAWMAVCDWRERPAPGMTPVRIGARPDARMA